jgi:hypothetical protein
MALNLGHIRIAFPPLLTGTVGARLKLLNSGPRADCYRLTFERNGVPGDLLVKHFSAASSFSRSELASNRLCADLNIHVVPPLVALHESRLLLVTRYLNDARDLTTVVAGNSGAIDLAMKQLARTMAALISGTCLDYSLHLERDDNEIRVAEAAALAAKQDALLGLGAQFGADTNGALRDCLVRLLQSYRDPLRVSWTQGDPAPSNVLFTPVRAWLVDFEYGGWRHALHDLAQWYVRAPLPEDWYANLSGTVAESLLRTGIYADELAFRTDLAVMQSYAALYMLGWLPTADILSRDSSWVNTWTVRDALICATGRGGRAAGAVTGLERLSAWFGALHAGMQQQWPDRGAGEPDWRAVAVAAARDGAARGASED